MEDKMEQKKEKSFPSLIRWVENHSGSDILMVLMIIFSFRWITSITILFSSFSIITSILLSIFIMVLLPFCVLIIVMGPFYLYSKYKFKIMERELIFSNFRFHPEQSLEDSMRIAMKNSTLWKLGALVKMWKDINDNSCMRIYRGPYA